jgi:large subunit GTPase 1
LADAEAREAQQNASSSHLETKEGDDEEDSEDEARTSSSGDEGGASESETDDEGVFLSGEEDTPDAKDPRAKVLSVLELEDLFVKAAPNLSCECLCLDITKR